MAATSWPDNAALIADCHRLGYLKDADRVIDLTYGRGLWWSDWRPRRLVSNDLDPRFSCELCVDFRDTGQDADSYDAGVFDPPYVSQGGRSTSTVPDFYHRYGLADAASTPAGLQAVIRRDHRGSAHRPSSRSRSRKGDGLRQ